MKIPLCYSQFSPMLKREWQKTVVIPVRILAMTTATVTAMIAVKAMRQTVRMLFAVESSDFFCQYWTNMTVYDLVYFRLGKECEIRNCLLIISNNFSTLGNTSQTVQTFQHTQSNVVSCSFCNWLVFGWSQTALVYTIRHFCWKNSVWIVYKDNYWNEKCD